MSAKKQVCFEVASGKCVRVKLFGLWLEATTPNAIHVTLERKGKASCTVSWQALTLLVAAEDMEEIE